MRFKPGDIVVKGNVSPETWLESEQPTPPAAQRYVVVTAHIYHGGTFNYDLAPYHAGYPSGTYDRMHATLKNVGEPGLYPNEAAFWKEFLERAQGRNVLLERMAAVELARRSARVIQLQAATERKLAEA